MTVLEERTKIRTDNSIPITTEIVIQDIRPIWKNYQVGAFIDILKTNINLMTAGSTKMVAIKFFPELSEKAKEILNRLYKFAELSENWDGNDSIPPSHKIIDKSINFLKEADEYDLPVYFAAPGPNGEIIIEYKSGSKTAEVYFEEDNFSEMILYNGQHLIYNDEINLDRLIQHLEQPDLIHA